VTTAADFDTDLEEDERSFPWGKAAIGALPMVLVVYLLSFHGEFIFGEPDEVSAIEHYPAVAIVLVAGESQRRAVPIEGSIAAERVAMLRAREPSVIVELNVAAGQLVRKGEALCHLKSMNGGGEQILSSPMDGKVTSVAGPVGAKLEAAAPCASVTDLSSLVATAEISQGHAEVVKAGDVAEVAVGTHKMRGGVRVVYPGPARNETAPRLVEIELPEGHRLSAGQSAEIRLRTEQVIAVHVPFAALSLHPTHGMSVRIVEGEGPLGVLTTMPITLIAATDDGFYVQGVPEEARLVVTDPDYSAPADGEKVRIGKVV
jgi:multidrug efflux pump subunit AcrA (membrane-fusion protein)